MKKPACRGWIDSGNAVKSRFGLLVAAEFVLGFIEIDEPAHEQIQAPIVVVIEPYRARRPARRGHTSLCRNIGERAIAIIVVENAASVLRYIQVGPTFSVIVAHRDAHSVAASADARLLRHIRECSVSIVVIDGIAQGRLRIVEITAPAVYEINVHPAAVVIVDERATGAGSFRQIIFRGAAVDMAPAYSA